MTAKEVWYVWDKKTVIRGVREVLISNGKRHKILGGSDLGQVPTDKDCFTFYTLGETRERVACEDCGGKGKRKLTDFVSKVGFSGVCICCQGRGYIWKTGVGQ